MIARPSVIVSVAVQCVIGVSVIAGFTAAATGSIPLAALVSTALLGVVGLFAATHQSARE
ncbi:hypothetical protein HYG77_10765 [Rhodococcus sp. ZPP]|uniref:hypothetical protein n=1 Tax=Rhodococcus sp. ZPP TaxID=2749906 RepID=UPI001AD8989C|nr:hypothetical protein [Rhodococcus sp. ZPP]QTJ66033.1 hypothetical protein HYG77_10765 [Rhodococcus sp. ZPP]